MLTRRVIIRTMVTNGNTMDKRRTEVSTGTAGLSINYIDIAFDKGQAVNIHGYRCNVCIEPQDADANSNGILGIYVLPAGVIQNADLPITYGQFGDEKFAPYLWGLKPWCATNQTPFDWEFAPKTSRNMQSGGRIVLVIRIEGQSAGLSRMNTSQTCFTSALK